LSDRADKDPIHDLKKLDFMKSENFQNRELGMKKARSAILSLIAALALATAIISGLYVSGVIGNHPSTSGIRNNTMERLTTTGVIPGGEMIARNVTESICGFSSTATNNSTTSSNSTTTTTSSCLPPGFA
jgi:hypothetical protein